MLNDVQREQFYKQGYLVLDDIMTGVIASKIIGRVNLLAWNLIICRGWQNSHSSLVSADSAYQSLAKIDRKSAGSIFDAVIKIPELNRYVYQEDFEIIVKQLLKSDNVLSPPSQMNLRTDHPSEERFLYPWHTDYSYNFSSKNSVVFWIPLHDVDLNIGSLHVIPSSHLLSHRIKINSTALLSHHSASYFEVQGVNDLLCREGEIRCNLSLGQGLVFHSNLLHKSGINNSNQVRYSIQSRWFDANSDDALANSYIGGIDENNDPSKYLHEFLDH